MKRQADSIYTKKHDEKSNARQVPFKLYLSNEEEAKINDYLNKQGNRKAYLIDLIKADMRTNGIDI
ncbi:hypothetical protein [Acinetobacter baumannii]|uniref:hypothetical protein n=1 Tax=Acinetobacter baumannii TaxID=470 RepID=UPI002340DDBB|nr:hypothetical protein [Acinetobacter baumannii]MDC4147481.1 hypothetical protein [Acinetobacter baumannii]